jgi:hypothetical protein
MKILQSVALSFLLFTLNGCFSSQYIDLKPEDILNKKYTEEKPYSFIYSPHFSPILGSKNEVVAEFSMDRLALAWAAGEKSGYYFSWQRNAFSDSEYPEINADVYTTNTLTNETTKSNERLIYKVSHNFRNENFEAGYIYFKRLEKSIRFEFITGINYGHGYNKYSYTGPNFPGTYVFTEDRFYTSAFVQGDIGFCKKWFEGSVSLRAGWLGFIKQKFAMDYTAETYRMNRNNIYLQPEAAFAFGPRLLRLQIKYSSALEPGSSDVKINNIKWFAALVCRVDLAEMK